MYDISTSTFCEPALQPSYTEADLRRDIEKWMSETSYRHYLFMLNWRYEALYGSKIELPAQSALLLNL